ncbi:putative guanine deaminase [Aspergillus mulundensis]|uniref:Probable guanine deaminase n=1 Tax=Aspergillus mulundensis TaxID=1810919 RepID=A0A3D8SBR8_9EURO|nr:hypothetical protein DSM5745_03860 [Aspergillus mulundensis]RDW83534.1 hypothetical protein DSM5745_03860 [Aspergillus mulundensis]
MASILVFQGAAIHSTSLETLEIIENAILVVTDGRITAFHKSSESHNGFPPTAQVHRLPPGEFLIPGFVDTHNHAPQWPMRGLGQGLHILDWLSEITFPVEARFADPAYAASMYEHTVEDFLRQGITTASYYSSRHAEATKILAEICHRKGQRAFVGKCNMDRNAPDYIQEASASDSLRETEECIEHIRRLPGCDRVEGALVNPVVTPRFAISCTPELLQGLGEIVQRDNYLAVQTHFNEAQQEIDATTELFPQFKGSEADLYESYGLLNSRSILAHCTIMTDHEKEKIHSLKCGVAHCPIANMTVGGGFMVAPVRDLLRRGIKVGLGTDSGGGWASQMLAVIRQAMIASNAREVLSEGKDKALTFEETFYLATLGGARVLRLEDRIGNFEVGKEFDAIWVSTTTGLQSAMTPREGGDSLRRVFEKYIMTGDDRNVAHVANDIIHAIMSVKGTDPDILSERERLAVLEACADLRGALIYDTATAATMTAIDRELFDAAVEATTKSRRVFASFRERSPPSSSVLSGRAISQDQPLMVEKTEHCPAVIQTMPLYDVCMDSTMLAIISALNRSEAMSWDLLEAATELRKVRRPEVVVNGSTILLEALERLCGSSVCLRLY